MESMPDFFDLHASEVPYFDDKKMDVILYSCTTRSKKADVP